MSVTSIESCGPDSFEKELTDASEKREAEENDGDSSAQARETVPAEQESAENVAEKTA
jgi:hypothetical protein